LAEGEEAITSERLVAESVGDKWNVDLPFSFPDNRKADDHNPKYVKVRRWSRGWICKPVAKPEPVDVEAQLREAGATIILYGIDYNGDCLEVFIRRDGKVNVHARGLTLPQAVAALLASQADTTTTWVKEVRELADKLDAANAEVARLTRDRDGLQKTVNEQGALIVEQRSEIERLRGIIEHNNRENAVVLASLREENHRLTEGLRVGCFACAVVAQLRADAQRTRDILADMAKGPQ